MSDTVIRVDNLSKKYIIGHQKQERYTSLRDVISSGAKSFWQGLTGDRHKDLDDMSKEFWALTDVSFEIKQGDHSSGDWRFFFCRLINGDFSTVVLCS